MPIPTEIQESNDPDFIEYVESLPGSDISDMLASRIIPSFTGAMHRHRIRNFSQTALTYWTLEMMLRPMKASTVERYLGALHTLYKDWLGSGSRTAVSEQDGDAVKNSTLNFSIPAEVVYDDSSVEEIKMTASNMKYAVNLSKINKNPLSIDHTYLHALLYLLINPEATLSDVVDMKFSDAQPESFHIEDIKLAMRKAPQAQYVFPLQQGKRRKPAILHDLVSGIRTATRAAGLEFGNSFSRESITALWIQAAISQNIPYSEIRTIVKQLPHQYSFLTMLPPVFLSKERKDEIINRVAGVFINNTTGWYVMRLRSGVTPETVKEELQHRKYPHIRQIEFYYPQRSVSKLVKKKAVKTEVPVIPGILFFRMRYDKISKMMSVIGDLAWCYRTTNTPTSPYSAIPMREMKTFQRSVGLLTADVEMDIIASQPPLNIGDEVIIENGSPLDGRQAVIRKVRSNDGSLSYTLRLSDSEFIHWKEVTVPASALTKVDTSDN